MTIELHINGISPEPPADAFPRLSPSPAVTLIFTHRFPRKKEKPRETGFFEMVEAEGLEPTTR